MNPIKLKVKSIPVRISTETIRLDALLKLAGAVSTGGQAKYDIQSGAVELDGSVCTMRGKKIFPGQKVRYGGNCYEVTGGTKDGENVGSELSTDETASSSIQSFLSDADRREKP